MCVCVWVGVCVCGEISNLTIDSDSYSYWVPYILNSLPNSGK